ncbi:TrbI/VirB10 family protein [Pseudoxanthomonas dokdonensis]|uniref:Secretion protein n=1 Tax=Pseudoxanthomonas dokdonensis TaxID=344882 RepID=A0A0R0D281_9GAMM|nr:TrbI/VirB10 family protein [Pseudoxanthomonas dokdonensis]KRG72068.1 hypothetical protein ABB29_01005 [Pseudoxanthomonas dokdonensis]
MNTHTPPQDGHAGADGNPYMAQSPQEMPSQAGLDASAPVLQTADNQRLNRKALLFLAALVLLLLAAGWLLLRSASGEKEAAPAVRNEQVEVPAAPEVPPVPASAPIPLADAAAPSLPPMPEPPQDDMFAEASQPVPRGPTLAERRTMSDAASAPAPAGFGQPGPQNPQDGLLQPTQASSATFLNQPDALLLRGTYIRCALETRIITDVNGFTSCVVTEPVYSVNGSRLLLPKGSKVFGQYASNAIRGKRAAVVWDRIVTPTGIDVTMSSPGIDQLGSAGHPGDYSAHWGERIGSALFISLLSDAFKYYGEENGPTTTTAYPGAGAVVQDPFESNTAQTLQDLANQAVQRSANREPTITINQGSILNIYVSKDVDFSGVLRN